MVGPTGPASLRRLSLRERCSEARGAGLDQAAMRQQFAVAFLLALLLCLALTRPALAQGGVPVPQISLGVAGSKHPEDVSNESCSCWRCSPPPYRANQKHGGRRQQLQGSSKRLRDVSRSGHSQADLRHRHTSPGPRAPRVSARQSRSASKNATADSLTHRPA